MKTNMEILKDIYVPKFYTDGYCYVFDKNNTMTIKFIHYIENTYPGIQQYLIDIMNGEKIEHKYHIKYVGNNDTALLMVNNIPIGEIRGWGFITSTLYRLLSDDVNKKAAEIQDNFGKWIESITN